MTDCWRAAFLPPAPSRVENTATVSSAEIGSQEDLRKEIQAPLLCGEKPTLVLSVGKYCPERSRRICANYLVGGSLYVMVAHLAQSPRTIMVVLLGRESKIDNIRQGCGCLSCVGSSQKPVRRPPASDMRVWWHPKWLLVIRAGADGGEGLAGSG